jgi:hypothetical protein
MTTLAKAKKVAAKFKATLVDEKVGYSHCCRIEAPKGHIWVEGAVHELVDDTDRSWKPDYQYLIDRMEYGVEKCEDINCDWCNEA